MFSYPVQCVVHTHAHMHIHSSLYVPDCENTGSWPPTLRHPPQEETTPALPVALKQRSQVPCRSPVSFVLTAGRKPSVARGHRALGSKKGVCLCVCIFHCCGSVQRFCSLRSHAFTHRAFSPLTLQCMNSGCGEGVEREGESSRKLQ